MLGRVLYASEPRQENQKRFWWPGEPTRVQLPRPPSPKTLCSLNTAATSIATMQLRDLPHKVGRFIVSHDGEKLREKGCIFLAHPLHPQFDSAPVLLASAGRYRFGPVFPLNQPGHQTVGSILPMLPREQAKHLLDCASCPVFKPAVSRAADVPAKHLTILTSFPLEKSRKLLFAGDDCVLYEALDVEEFATKLRSFELSVSNCKFVLGELPVSTRQLHAEIAEGLWLSVQPLRQGSMTSYRLKPQSILFAGTEQDDYDVAGGSRDEWRHELWAEFVSSVQSHPGFRELARLPRQQQAPSGLINVPAPEVSHRSKKAAGVAPLAM